MVGRRVERREAGCLFIARNSFRFWRVLLNRKDSIAQREALTGCPFRKYYSVLARAAC
jgi:hypothetical protein